MTRTATNHRSPEIAKHGYSFRADLKSGVVTHNRVLIYPASGTIAGKPAPVSVQVPGDQVFMYKTGQFKLFWNNMAAKLGFNSVFMQGDFSKGANAEAICAQLTADNRRKTMTVFVVHNDTGTGVTSDIPAVRAEIDAEN